PAGWVQRRFADGPQAGPNEHGRPRRDRALPDRQIGRLHGLIVRGPLGPVNDYPARRGGGRVNGFDHLVVKALLTDAGPTGDVDDLDQPTPRGIHDPVRPREFRRGPLPVAAPQSPSFAVPTEDVQGE